MLLGLVHNIIAKVNGEFPMRNFVPLVAMRFLEVIDTLVFISANLIRRSVLKIGYIVPQDLVPPI